MAINYTPLSEAKDATGNTVRVGSICIYLGSGDDGIGRKGERVIVRAIKAPRHDDMNTFRRGPRAGQFKSGCSGATIELRVDTDIDKDDDADTWSWSAWVQENELAIVSRVEVA